MYNKIISECISCYLKYLLTNETWLWDTVGALNFAGSQLQKKVKILSWSWKLIPAKLLQFQHSNQIFLPFSQIRFRHLHRHYFRNWFTLCRKVIFFSHILDENKSALESSVFHCSILAIRHSWSIIDFLRDFMVQHIAERMTFDLG